MGNKKGRPNKGPKTHNPHDNKKGKELDYCGRKLFHPWPL
jgi:hypothetical protein